MRAVVFKPVINQFLLSRKEMTPKKFLATCNLFHFLFLKLKVREKTFINKEKKENQSEKRVNTNKTKSK